MPALGVDVCGFAPEFAVRSARVGNGCVELEQATSDAIDLVALKAISGRVGSPHFGQDPAIDHDDTTGPCPGEQRPENLSMVGVAVLRGAIVSDVSMPRVPR